MEGRERGWRGYPDRGDVAREDLGPSEAWELWHKIKEKGGLPESMRSLEIIRAKEALALAEYVGDRIEALQELVGGRPEDLKYELMELTADLVRLLSQRVRDIAGVGELASRIALGEDPLDEERITDEYTEPAKATVIDLNSRIKREQEPEGNP